MRAGKHALRLYFLTHVHALRHADDQALRWKHAIVSSQLVANMTTHMHVPMRADTHALRLYVPMHCTHVF